VWLERLNTAGEFDQVRRLGEKWALDVPPSWRGRLTAVRGKAVEEDRVRVEEVAGEQPVRLSGTNARQEVPAFGGAGLRWAGPDVRGPAARRNARARIWWQAVAGVTRGLAVPVGEPGCRSIARGRCGSPGRGGR
jgi:hypothetical protein